MKKYSKYIVILFLITFLISLCFIPISVSRFIPLVEEQVKEELGVNAHIDRLIMQVGPSLKLKTPIVHITYADGTTQRVWGVQGDNARTVAQVAETLYNKPDANLSDTQKEMLENFFK